LQWLMCRDQLYRARWFIVRTSRNFAFTLALFAAMLATAGAQSPSPSPQLSIDKAVVTFASGGPYDVTITGVGFGTSPASVRLNQQMLAVQTWTDTTIVALIPVSFGPGTQVLEVYRGTGSTQYSSLDLTIGNQGPQGIQGPAGASAGSGYQVVFGTTNTPNATTAAFAQCPTGKVPVGGAYLISDGDKISGFFPVNNGISTAALITGPSTADRKVFAFCMNQ